MTFGENLKMMRKKSNLSQEQFAEKINVSRSAVAKWESDIGMPDINNLKIIARVLDISIDNLLSDDKLPCLNETEDFHEKTVQMESFGRSTTSQAQRDYMGETITDLIGRKCDIDLSGWNDGVYDAYIIGQDSNFVFYLIENKNMQKVGALGKNHITNIEELEDKKHQQLDHAFLQTNRTYLLDKHVMIEQACKDGIVKGFFDFTNDNYLDVTIRAFEDNLLVLGLGNTVEISKVAKIQEL